MIRGPLLLALLLFPLALLRAEEDGPPISITSPDNGTTFAYASIKNRSLVWDEKNRVLLVRVTFTDARQNLDTPNDDQHEFRLPGVTFDATRGLFSATTAKGEVIPVAKIKKALFFKTISTLPNARVRIVYPHGQITVILEAIRPDDPAMRPSPTDPDGTHKVNIDQVLSNRSKLSYGNPSS